MERRTITIGLTLSVVIYIASIIFLKVFNLIGLSVYNITNGYSALLLNRLDDILEIMPWFVPGFIVGYISKNSAIKNGAIVGAIAGGTFSIVGLIYGNAQAHELMIKVANLFNAGSLTIRYAFLFSLSSAFGYLTAKHRQVL